MLSNRESLQEPLLHGEHVVSSLDVPYDVEVKLTPEQEVLTKLRILNRAISLLRERIAKDPEQHREQEKSRKAFLIFGLCCFLTTLGGVALSSEIFFIDSLFKLNDIETNLIDQFNSNIIPGRNISCQSLGLKIEGNESLNDIPQLCSDLINNFFKIENKKGGFIIGASMLGTFMIFSFFLLCKINCPHERNINLTIATTCLSTTEKNYLYNIAKEYNCELHSLPRILAILEEQVKILKSSEAFHNFDIKKFSRALFFKAGNIHEIVSTTVVRDIIAGYAYEPEFPAKLEIVVQP